MKDIKKLKDLYNMEEYLDKECYCPGEIYSFDGFFFQIFKADQDCKYLGQREAPKKPLKIKKIYFF